MDTTLEIRDFLIENAQRLIIHMIEEDLPFRLIIWNNNNWNKELPKRIMDSFPDRIVLDIKEETLKLSKVGEMGEVRLVTEFDGEIYNKIVSPEEIYAVLDLDGNPMILVPFNKEPNSMGYNTILEVLSMNGIEEDNAKKSLDLFLKNNPGIIEDK